MLGKTSVRLVGAQVRSAGTQNSQILEGNNSKGVLAEKRKILAILQHYAKSSSVLAFGIRLSLTRGQVLTYVFHAGVQPRTMHMLCKKSTTELNSQPRYFSLSWNFCYEGASIL
jgi:hypothetical protein